MVILYRGRSFILEDAGDSYRLTSVEKRNGRATILEFTKNEEVSSKAVHNFAYIIIRKEIVKNHYKGVR
jgi:hypothetical protein